MAVWRSRKQQGAWYVSATGGGGDDDVEKKVPKGYVPMVLVDDDDGEGEGEDGGGDQAGQRIMVHVRMLREPCVAALLDMAARQFGLSQRGVLRVPCNVTHFEQMIKGW